MSNFSKKLFGDYWDIKNAEVMCESCKDNFHLLHEEQGLEEKENC